MNFDLDSSKDKMPAFSEVCSLCKHFDDSKPYARRCAAFKEGIPHAIWLGANKHIQPFPDDNGIRFEKIDVANLAHI